MQGNLPSNPSCETVELAQGRCCAIHHKHRLAILAENEIGRLTQSIEALLLEHVIRFNMDASTDRYRRIGELMGMEMDGMSATERTNRTTAALAALRRQAGIEGGLAKRGVHPSDFKALTKYAFKDVCLATNPRRANIGDIKATYGKAL
jgi:alcohol dehydrogenase class IV